MTPGRIQEKQEQSLTMFSVILSFPVTLPAIVGLRAFGAWMMLFLRRTLAEFVRLSAASVTSEHLRQHDKVIGSDNRSPTHLRAGFFV